MATVITHDIGEDASDFVTNRGSAQNYGGVGGDFVSTGWKHRGGYTDMNASGVEIIYGAFGIQPIQGDGKINQGRAR